jgi:enamine deaminase RidA (YjgF/YER057c/UK114 family)
MERRLVPADSPYAPAVGYSRAVRVGAQVHVSGTCAVMPDGGDPPADAYGQARRCLEIISEALLEAGARLEDVVRTRIFLVNEDDWQDVGRAHHEFLGDVKPASTMVLIGGILDPRWVVEIEADAVVPEDR